MFRYKNKATLAIEIDITKDYTIVAMADWRNEDKKYYVNFYIKGTDIERLELIDSKENTEFESDIKTIKTDITTYVTKLFNEGFFNYYINLYEFENACFEKGLSILEKERLGDK